MTRRMLRRAGVGTGIAVIVAVTGAAPAWSLTARTIAGSGEPGFTGDGRPAVAAMLHGPQGVAATADGAVLIADTDNNRLRRVVPDGSIQTIAGTGATRSSGDGGPASGAALPAPTAVAAGPDGRIYVAEPYRVRVIDQHGTIDRLAGTGVPGSSGDGGPARAARFDGIAALAVDSAGGVLVADRLNRRVRRIAADGTIATVAGSGSAGNSGDGGPASAAAIGAPSGIATAADGSLLIADSDSGTVREVDPTGRIRTIAGGGSTAPAIGRAADDAELMPVAIAAFSGGFAIASAEVEDDDLKGAVLVVGADGIIRDIATTGSCDTADGLCAPRALWAGPNGLLTADPAAHRVLSLGSAATPWPAATVPGGSTPPFPAAVTALTARRRGAELMLRFSAPPGRLKVAVRVGKRWMTVRRGRTTARLSKVKVSLRGARRRARSVRITVVTTTGVSVSRTVAVPAR
jgi:hypothetical protein